MKIYVDLVLLLNFAFDFLLLLTVSLILKRNISINRIIIGAFIGSLSILFLFTKITSIQLFLYKIIISIAMTIATFNYKNVKYTLKNLIYLYTTSIILGGFLYYLNIEFSYKQIGIAFINKGLSINVAILLITSPLILYLYIKQGLHLKYNYKNYFKVDIHLKNQIIKCNGYMDTGNRLVDPYLKKPVILLDKRKKITDISNYHSIYVPYQTISETNIIKCIKAEYVDIKGIGKKENVLIGILNKKLHIDGIDVILNNMLMEEQND